MADQLLGGIVINEVLVDPSGATNFDTDGNGSAQATDEYIELYNDSSTAIDISGLQLWDSGQDNWFTFPAGSVLQPGAHAMVITGVQTGGNLPKGGPDDLFFDAGRGSAVINNGGDNLVVLDPTNNEYILATFNGDAQEDPTDDSNSNYVGFPTDATQIGSGEDFGNDTDGESLQRAVDGGDVVLSTGPTPGTTNICFANGTYFQTPTGRKPIEALRPGQLVNTLDHGPQRVRWVFSKTWSVKELRKNPKLWPIRIRKGALGNTFPRHDLRLSQHHRILVNSPITHRMANKDGALIPAKSLLTVKGVSCELPTEPITYFHVMFDEHEIVLANGYPSESLYLGKEALKALSPAALAELELVMGHTANWMQKKAHSPSRQFVNGKRAEKLVTRHTRNSKPFISA